LAKLISKENQNVPHLIGHLPVKYMISVELQQLRLKTRIQTRVAILSNFASALLNQSLNWSEKKAQN
jgi:hypothetical protein